MSDRAVSPINLNPDLSFDAPSTDATHGSNSEIEPASISPPNMSPREPKKPARKTPFTVASVLPECDYKEEWEPKERRTDAYLSVQGECFRSFPNAISIASYSELYKPSGALHKCLYQATSLTLPSLHPRIPQRPRRRPTDGHPSPLLLLERGHSAPRTDRKASHGAGLLHALVGLRCVREARSGGGEAPAVYRGSEPGG